MQMKETMKDTTETMHLSLITEEATGHWYKWKQQSGIATGLLQICNGWGGVVSYGVTE